MKSKLLLDTFTDDLKTIYKDKSEGVLHYLPTPDATPRLQSAIPGTGRGSNVLVFAGSGVGKSKFVRFFFLVNPLIQAAKHDMDLHIIYNNIEESVSQIFARDYLREFNKITGSERKLTVFDLLGYTKLNGQKIIAPYLDQIKENVARKYGDRVHFIRKSNAWDYYVYVMEFLMNHGRFIATDGKEFNPLKSKKNIDSFIPHNRNFIFVVILDRILLMNSKHGANTASFIQSNIHNLIFNLICKGITVTIQQQNDESSVAEYTRNGQVILDKIEPALINLKNNRATKDPAHYVYGLFNPHRFDLNGKHRGYDIEAMNGKLRSLHVLKSREGAAEGGIIHFGFDGALEDWYELPLPNDPSIDNYYKYFQNL